MAKAQTYITIAIFLFLAVLTLVWTTVLVWLLLWLSGVVG